MGLDAGIVASVDAINALVLGNWDAVTASASKDRLTILTEAAFAAMVTLNISEAKMTAEFDLLKQAVGELETAAATVTAHTATLGAAQVSPADVLATTARIKAAADSLVSIVAQYTVAASQSPPVITPVA